MHNKKGDINIDQAVLIMIVKISLTLMTITTKGTIHKQNNINGIDNLIK